MSRRRRRSERPEEAFLRALKATRGEPAAGPPPGVKDPARAAKDPVPAGAPTVIDEPAVAEAVDPRVAAELERRAAAAEVALEEVRAEAERRLAEARAAEQLEAAQAAQPEPERSEDVQREIAESLERRLEAVAESERRLREERERWETDAQTHAERRAAELAEAERRIAAAHAHLREESASAVDGAGAAPTDVSEASGAPDPAAAPAGVSHAADAAAARPIAPGASAPTVRGPLARLGLGRARSRDTVCVTCGREFAGSPSEARARGWTISGKGRALCADCQREGWHYPKGASVPLRELPTLDTQANSQR